MNAAAMATVPSSRRDRIREFVAEFTARRGGLPTLRELVNQYPFAEAPQPHEHADLEGLEIAGRFFWRGTWRRS